MSRPAHRSAARFVFLVVLIDAIGLGIIMPVLPQIVMTLGHVGLSEATRIGGWLGMVYAAVQFVTGPLIGNLADRFGRRPVLLGSLGGFAVDYALMGFAPSLGWLFLGRILAGLFGASYGAAGAAMADISAPEDRARHFGMIGAAFGIGFVVGPAIGGLLGEISARAPFHAAALLAAGNLLFGLIAFPETLAPDKRRPFDWMRANPLGALLSLRRRRGLLPLTLANFWWALAMMIYPTTWSFYAIAAFGWSPGRIGLSLALVGGLMALNQIFLVGRVVARFGERRAAQIGIFAAMLGFLAFAFIRIDWLVFPILFISSLQSLVMPSMSGMMSQRMPADAQGELQGFMGSLQAIAAIIAPAIYAPALAWFTRDGASWRFPGIAFLLATAAAIVALSILAMIRRASAASQKDGDAAISPA